MTTQTAQTATNAARRASLLSELDRIGLSPDGVQMMFDHVQARMGRIGAGTTAGRTRAAKPPY